MTLGQTIKGARGIPRCCQPMKDVANCDKPGRAVKQALTPGFLNGETHHSEAVVLRIEHIDTVEVSERIETS